VAISLLTGFFATLVSLSVRDSCSNPDYAAYAGSTCPAQTTR
jgi:hypothetical protein